MANKKSIINLDCNQPLFVGLDVHKSKWAVCIIHCDEVIGKFTIPGDFQALKKLLDRYDGQKIHSVYEAGFLGFHLHFKLTEIGVNNIVVASNKIPVQVGDLVKTDKRDSQKLAFSLSKGLLRGIHVPTMEQLNIRHILRTREQYKRKRSRAIAQLKMLLLQYDIQLTRGLTNAMRELILNLNLPEYVLASAKMYLEEFDFLESKIYELDKMAKKECAKNHYEKYNILQSVPGIGATTAAALCFEIGDWKRFNNAGQLCAYLGLTPREYSSGEHVYKGRITGQGNPWLRSYLVESAWKTMAGDPAIREYYNRIKFNSGSGKKAVVAVARKMVCRMYSLVKNNQCYQLGMVA